VPSRVGFSLRGTLASLLLLTTPTFSATPRLVHDATVYKEPHRYGGWPANHGIWSWGNEILVGFSAAYFQLKTPDRHPYDNTKPEEPRLARSLDGGETWAIEAPPSLLPPEQGGAPVRDLDKPMDFTDPNFAMTLRFTDTNKGPSRFWYSVDRGKTWLGPYAFPLLNQQGIAARTDYIVNGKRDAFVFLTASKSDGKEGRVLCARTEDGGLKWEFVSFIGGEPSGFSIMPSSVRVSPKELLAATRVKYDRDTGGIEVFRSRDNGSSWQLFARPVAFSGPFNANPPSLIRLRDGRLCLTYGVRTPPYRICARLSNDGRTWSDEIVLRNDGAMWDIGYVRSVQRLDGEVVTVYYFPEQAHTERIIAATIWDPGAK
jgi:BNR repeat-like domain